MTLGFFLSHALAAAIGALGMLAARDWWDGPEDNNSEDDWE